MRRCHAGKVCPCVTPQTRMIHFNNGGGTFGRTESEDRPVSWYKHRVAGQSNDSKDMAGQNKAADLACAGGQHMEQDALPLLDPERSPCAGILPLIPNRSYPTR